MKTLLLSLLIASVLLAQERKVEATWLHRYLPRLSEAGGDLASGTCHYKPVFGEADTEKRLLQSVTRFAEVALDAHGNCQTVHYDREEEIYFVLEGKGVLHYGDQTHALRTNDFTYLPPGMKHSIANNSEPALRVLVMGFKIPATTLITGAPIAHAKIVKSWRRQRGDRRRPSDIGAVQTSDRTAHREARRDR